MCYQHSTQYVCGHVSVKQGRCEARAAFGNPFAPFHTCENYQESADRVSSPCGLGSFYCKKTEDGAFLEQVHEQIDQIPHDLHRLQEKFMRIEEVWANFHLSADQTQVPREVREQHPKFRWMCEQRADLNHRRQELLQMRQKALATSHSAFDFYKQRVTQILAAKLPLTPPTNEFLVALSETRARRAAAAQVVNLRQPPVPRNTLGEHQVALPPAGPAGDNIYVSHLRRSFSAQHNPLHNQHLLGGSNGSQHVSQQVSVEQDGDVEVISPPRKTRQAKGKGKTVERVASTSAETDTSSLRRSTRARGKKVKYAESEGSIPSRDPSPSKSETSTFAPSGSENSSSPGKAYEDTSAPSKRPKSTSAAASAVAPSVGQTLRSTIGDWKRISEVSELSSHKTLPQQQKSHPNGFAAPYRSPFALATFQNQTPYAGTFSTSPENRNQLLSYKPRVPSNLRPEAPNSNPDSQLNGNLSQPSRATPPRPVIPTPTPSLIYSSSDVGMQRSIAASKATPNSVLPQSSVQLSGGSSSHSALIAALNQMASRGSIGFSSGSSAPPLHADSQTHSGPDASAQVSTGSTFAPPANNWAINNFALSTLSQIAAMQPRNRQETMSTPAPITGSPSIQGPTVGNSHSPMARLSTPQGPHHSPLLTQSTNMSGIDRMMAQNSEPDIRHAPDASTSMDYPRLRRSLGSNPDLRTPQGSISTSPFDSDPRKRPLPASSPLQGPTKRSRLWIPSEEDRQTMLNLARHHRVSTPSQGTSTFSQYGMPSTVLPMATDNPTPPLIFLPRGDRYPASQAQQYTEINQDLVSGSQDMIDLTMPSTAFEHGASQTQHYHQEPQSEYAAPSIPWTDFVDQPSRTEQHTEANQDQESWAQVIDFTALNTAFAAGAPETQDDTETNQDMRQYEESQGQEVAVEAPDTAFMGEAPQSHPYTDMSQDEETQSGNAALTGLSTEFGGDGTMEAGGWNGEGLDPREDWSWMEPFLLRGDQNEQDQVEVMSWRGFGV